MRPPGADTVLVRYGEMGVKSGRVQGRMEERLVANIEALLADRGIEGDVERRWTRPLIHTPEAAVESATRAAADVFGVVSTSPAVRVPAERDAIQDALVRTARAHYSGGTFAVDARRADDRLPFTSKEIEEFGGSAIWDAVESRFDPAVDLDDPDLTFSVECRDGEAFVFLDAIEGPGGLPLGSQARVVALVSGGIDSPVAAYQVMRRGSPVTAIYVDLGEYGGPDHEARAVETVRTLSGYAPEYPIGLYRVPAGETVALLADRMEQGRMLTLRRFMYRAAEHIAEREGAHGIVTGESIGQKSSQTARNLAVTDRATDIPIHRPLLAADKTDITERARAIGTFSDSTIPAGCNRFAPDQAETNARLDRLLAVEPDDLFERAERAAERAELLDPAADAAVR